MQHNKNYIWEGRSKCLWTFYLTQINKLLHLESESNFSLHEHRLIQLQKVAVNQFTFSCDTSIIPQFSSFCPRWNISDQCTTSLTANLHFLLNSHIVLAAFSTTMQWNGSNKGKIHSAVSESRRDVEERQTLSFCQTFSSCDNGIIRNEIAPCDWH